MPQTKAPSRGWSYIHASADCIIPPINANGIDVTANGQNMLHLKIPRAIELDTTPIDATKRFSINAVGRVISGATAKNAITAKYPDAPPCPTEE